MIYKFFSIIYIISCIKKVAINSKPNLFLVTSEIYEFSFRYDKESMTNNILENDMIIYGIFDDIDSAAS